MVDFTHNEFKGNRDVSINIHEQQSMGKQFDYCTNEELFNEQDFRSTEKRKRASELFRASIKWFILLSIGLLIIGVSAWNVWLGMGQKLDLNYMLNLSINLTSMGSSSITPLLNAAVIALVLILFIALPLRLIFQNLTGEDEIMMRHRRAQWEIKMILKERGI